VPTAEHKLRADIFFDCQTLFAPLSGADAIGLAVSGGSDSLALLYLAHDWAKQSGAKLHVLTVDHGLRAGSAAEAEAVAAICMGLGFAHETLKWQGPKPTTGIQAKARKARYDLMAGWCVSHDVPWLLTGHTADDQVETVAMRMARTDSVRSLAGIWPTREWGGVQIFRPLLGLSRAALRLDLQRRGVSWCDDPSNDNPVFERVRVRQRLHDQPRSDDLAAVAVAAQGQSRDDAAAGEAWLRGHCMVDALGFGQIPRAALAGLSRDVGLYVVDRLLQGFGGGDRTVDRAKRLALLSWLTTGAVGRRCLGGAVVAARRDVFLFGREWARISQMPFLVLDNQPVLWDQRFWISGAAGLSVQPAGAAAGFQRDPAYPAFVQQALPVLLDRGQPGLPRELPGVATKFISFP
jgi:tRNA(Ile)-lysidine synthase